MKSCFLLLFHSNYEEKKLNNEINNYNKIVLHTITIKLWHKKKTTELVVMQVCNMSFFYRIIFYVKNYDIIIIDMLNHFSLSNKDIFFNLIVFFLSHLGVYKYLHVGNLYWIFFFM